MNVERIDRYAAEQMKRFGVPSLCYAFVKDGKVVHGQALGTADLSTGRKPDFHTRYPICSLTKSMTALSLGMLADQGKLTFDDKIRTYLPEFQLEDSHAGDQASIRDLLTHMTGLPRHDALTFQVGEEKDTLEKLAARMGKLPMSREFRSRFEYVNLTYMVLSLLIERVSGKPYSRFLREQLFLPLDMKESSARTADMLARANRAKPYLLMEDGCAAETISFQNDNLSGAGNVNSTLADMAAYMGFLTEKKTAAGEGLISEQTRKQIFATHTIDWCGYDYKWPEMPVACYGLGWTIQPYRGNLCFCHAGSLYGFTAYMAFLPYERMGVVLLSNLEQSFLTHSLAHHLFDEALGLSFIDWEARYGENLRNTQEAYKTHNQALLKESVPKKDQPAAEPDRFTGAYENDGYGRLLVYQQEGRLHVTYGGWDYPLTHSFGNTYLLDVGRPNRPLLTRALFRLENPAEAAVDIWFEVGLEKPITFVRR